MMELVTASTPPPAILEHAVTASGGALLWLRPPAFEIRCEPSVTSGVLKLVVPLEGGGVVRQGGREAALEPGTFTWLDADAPYEMSMSHGRRLFLRLPLERVRRRHPQLDLRTALSRGASHPGERVVAQLLRGLAHEGREMSAGSILGATNLVLEALGMCATADVADVGRTRVERALAVLELRLGDPELQPEDIAREQRVSRRYLDGLFLRVLGRSLATHIRQSRLERAARDLEDRPDALASEVAQRWGFRDASHFSRLFRQRFAASPTAYRARRS